MTTRGIPTVCGKCGHLTRHATQETAHRVILLDWDGSRSFMGGKNLLSLPRGRAVL
jgi:hypothetical protein